MQAVVVAVSRALVQVTDSYVNLLLWNEQHCTHAQMLSNGESWGITYRSSGEEISKKPQCLHQHIQIGI